MEHLQLQLGDAWKPNYHTNLFNSDEHRFFDLPDTIGWKLSNDTLEFTKDTDQPFEKFLQSWLFFGLLSTILQKSSRRLSQDLTSDPQDYINTTKLNVYLESWRTDVVDHPADRSLRMIRAQVALEHARRIVKEYCSHESEMKYPQTHPCYVDPLLGLSLMVLGETLTNAKSKIIEKVGFDIHGWHGDAQEGWGTPYIVLERMKNKKWCPKLAEILKLQLRSNATSLLAAFVSHEQTLDNAAYYIQGHKSCTEKKCMRKFVGIDGKYLTQHELTCPRNDNHVHYSEDEELCKFIPLEIKDVVSLIKQGHIPLLEYDKRRGKVNVVEYEPYTHYATISHVWSDGYGNTHDNKLWKCQLDFFDRLFEEAQQEASLSQERRLFWIDTLAVPIHDEYKEQRRVAVRQIHQVYTNARYTIVIDKGLGQVKPANSYEGTAMKILASCWMRRLWTLQEAYLSRRLYFAFAERGAGKRLKNLEDLEEMYPKANDILTSNIPSAARSYFHNLLGNDRRARINDLPAGNGIEILASVWRAARWRATNHQEHETLALATLLNLDYEKTKFQDAGLLKERVKVTDEQLEEMMIDLWKLLDKTCPGSIPPGIIFLPGEKLKEPAFGWAPTTWMSNQELDYPDPLSNMIGAARLVPEGLLVKYPGFILHAKNRASILGENESNFHFPSDSTLVEWYSVELTGLRTNPPKGIETKEKQLAIILCRPKPKEIPEIALLVEIEERIVQRSFGDKQYHSTILHVYYDRRVRIWRETSSKLLSEWRIDLRNSIDHEDRVDPGYSKDEDKMICGEALDHDQRWYVGGRRPTPRKQGLEKGERDVEDVDASQTVPGDPIVTYTTQNAPETNVPEIRRESQPIIIDPLGGPERSLSSKSDFKTSATQPAATNGLMLMLAQTSQPFNGSIQSQYSVQPPLAQSPSPQGHTVTSNADDYFHSHFQSSLLGLPAVLPAALATESPIQTVQSSSTTSESSHTTPGPIIPQTAPEDNRPIPAVQAPGNVSTPLDADGALAPPRSQKQKPSLPSRPSTKVKYGNGSAMKPV